MICSELASPNVQRVLPSNTVAQAAALIDMSQEDLLVVCGPNDIPLGVVTARDIVERVVAKNLPPALTRVDEILSGPALFVLANASLDLACAVMGDEGVTRLLVLDPAGTVQGLITLRDVLLHGADELALATARRIGSRRSRSQAPRTEVPPIPPTSASADWEPSPEAHATNAAREEAALVLKGGVNELKEFP